MKRPFYTRLIKGVSTTVFSLLFISTASFGQLNLTSSSPTANAISVARSSDIVLNFDLNVDQATIDNGTPGIPQDDNISINGSQTGRILGTYSGDGTTTITFDPTVDFKPGEIITVTITDGVLGTGAEVANPTSFSFTAASGPFEGAFLEKTGTSILGIGWGTVAWGDYDGDGDLDLATVGWDPSFNYVSIIYNNTGGVFTDIGAALVGVANASCDWGDYDGDGDLDLAIAGLDDGGAEITIIYRNDAGVFTDIGAVLQGGDYSSVDWGDFDNDGDLDLAVAGRYFIGFTEFAASIIYENNAGVFTDIGAGLIGLSNGSADWVDYDNDGDLDLFLTGFDVGWTNRFANMYRNDGGGVFTEVATGLPGVGFSAADWGDYDNDGDLDLIMMGGQTPGPNDGAYIYRNDAGVFTDIGAGFSDGLEDGSARWGDFDGDGDLDVALTGQDFDLVGDYVALIYRNDGGVFTDINAGLFGVAGLAKGEWGDFDSDGDLDLLVIGEDSPAGLNSARIYQNIAQVDIISTIPTANANNVNPTSNITLNFDANIDQFSIDSGTPGDPTDDNLIITGSQTGLIAGTFSGDGTATITFDPINDFKPDEVITVTITNRPRGSGGEIAVPKSFSFIAASGPFEGAFVERPTAGISGVVYGNSDWGDYDGDGDIDIAVVGFDPLFNQIAVIYNNVNGVFTDIGAGLTGVSDSGCEWGDYDGDGDLDLVVAGLDPTFTNRLATIYRNDGGGAFTDIVAGLQGVDFASLDWGDYDNDGDLDLVVAGRYAFGPSFHSTTIYENDAGVFTDIGASLVGVTDGSADWGDYDADGDLDLLLTGSDESATLYFTIYRNDDGNFVDIGAALPGFGFSSADWGDYDNDGDLDIAVIGVNSIGTTGAFIYQNNAGTFVDIGAGLPDDISEGSIRWGDYDGDGELDLILTGQDTSPGDNITTAVFRNDAGIFTNINANLAGVTFQSLADWGDFDLDGDLDLFVTGEDVNGDVIGKLYENTVFNSFVTTWQTDNPGSTADNQIEIPTTGSGYNYDIYWEEVGNPPNNGTEPSGQTGDYTITFPSPGTYRVEISGAFPRIYFNAASFNPDKDSEKLLTVEQWGDVAWTSMQAAFSGCVNLTIPAVDAPNLAGVTSMNRMFYEAESLNSNINSWDVSTITDMEELFRDAILFNQPLDSWDVGNVNNMRRMFFFATAFNQNISGWDVSNVTNMNSMFGVASSFNQPVGGWIVDNVTDMGQMFSVATSFNQDLSGWNARLGGVTNIRSMFSGATVFNQDISGWVLNATNFSNFFRDATAFNQDISSWDVSGVTNMDAMFFGATAFDQDLTAWNFEVANVTSMESTFASTTYNQDLTNWEVGNVLSFNGMFEGNTAFNQDISGWDVSSAGDMRNMFSGASSFDQNLGGWVVSNLNNAFDMFRNSGLSIENYDNLLIGWAVQPLQSSVNFGAQGINYCLGSTARQNIITTFTWFINDDGPGCISIFQGPDVTGIEIIDGQADPVDFGSGEFLIGKTVQFTLQNELVSDITNLAVTVPGPDFSVFQPSITITGGSTLTIDIDLTGFAIGSFTETISIVSDQFTTPFVFDVTGEVTAAAEPEIKVFEGPDITGRVITDGDLIGLGMGFELRGTDLNSFFTITNIGSEVLNISDLSVSGTSFTLDTSAPLVILVDGTVVIGITLDGTVSGVFNETITITNDDPDEGIYDFPVVGQIQGPDIAAFDGPDIFFQEITDGQATPVNLGGSKVGTDLVRQITIANYGPVDLDISAINVTGSAFTITPNTPAIIPAEVDGVISDIVLTITLDGTTAGFYSESISIDSDDDDEPTFDFVIEGRIAAPPSIYWTENIGGGGGDDEIHQTDIDGNGFLQYYSGFADEISGLAIDYTNNRLYWTDAAQAEIFYGDIDAVAFAGPPVKIYDKNPGSTNDLEDLVLDIPNNHIYFTHGNAESGFTNKIARIDLDGTNENELIDTGLELPVGIELDHVNGKIYFTTNLVSTGTDARLYRADLNGSNVEELFYLPTPTVGGTFFSDVKIDVDNQVVYWAAGPIDGAPGTIYYNDLNEAAPFAAPSSFTFAGEPRGLDLDPINQKIYWVCKGANDGTNPAQIMRSDLDGNNIEILFTVTLYPSGYPPTDAGSAFMALDLRGLGVTPSLQADGLVFSGFTPTSADISWTNGDGSGRVVVMKEATAVDSDPTDNSTYAADNNFGSGDITGPNNYVVYNGSGNSVTVTGLTNGSTYHVRVYEYNGIPSDEKYLLATGVANPASFILGPEIAVFEGATPITSGVTSIDFGSALVGTDIDLTFDINNTGTIPLNIADISLALDAEFSITSALPTVIAAGGTNSFDVQLSGVVAGSFNDTITIDNDDSDEFSFTIPVTGAITATAEPEISVVYDPPGVNVLLADGQVTDVDFGSDLVGNDILKTFEIENIGSAVLTISGITVTGTDFSILSVPASVTVGGTESFTVQLSGAMAGVYNDVLTIQSDDADEAVFDFPVTGIITATAEPEINIFVGPDNTGTLVTDGQAASIDVGTADLGTDINQVFTIENTGTAELNISGITSSTTAFSLQTLLPAPIPPGATDNFTIQLSGASDGIFNAVITVDSDDTNEAAFDFPVSGTIQGPEITVFVGLDNSGAPITGGQASAIDFGTQLVGTDIDQEFAIENQGTSDLVISSINLGTTDFNVTTTVPFTVSPGSTSNFTIQLSGISTGIFTDNVVINSNDSDESTFGFPISGTIESTFVIHDGPDTSSPVIVNGQPDAVNVGQTPQGTDLDKEFVIANTRSTDLNILSITTDQPAVFSIINPPTTISPGAFASFIIRLNAQLPGVYTANVTISTDAGDLTFPVTGEVLALAANLPITVFNAVTPNGDGRHDFLRIENIESYVENKLVIYTKLGDEVYEVENYNNSDSEKRFEGFSNVGETKRLPEGTYYYVINFTIGDKVNRISGYILLGL